MKTIFSFIAVCMAVAVIGCQSTNPTVAPGAVSECGAKAGEPCTKDKSECCGAAKCSGAKVAEADANLGAVGEKSECQKRCPAAAAAEADANLGAVSEKSGCTKAAESGCTKAAEVDASLGAVSETSGCQKKCGGAVEADASLGAVSEKSECQKKCGAAKTGCSK